MEAQKKAEKKSKKKQKKEEVNLYKTMINELFESSDLQITLPSSLDSSQRRELADYASTFVGLRPKFRGHGTSRTLSVHKNNKVNDSTVIVSLNESEADSISKVLSSTEENLPLSDLPTRPPCIVESIVVTVPPIPIPRSTPNALPIHQYQGEILETIQKHQVIIISGETGSGKTTQVPQFILDDSAEKNKGCRIMLTQPRRMAAVSVAKRISDERKELHGCTVGHQIRLDSCIQPTTNLIVTTSYFNNCPIVVVPGRTFEIRTSFLGEILADTNYESFEMTAYINGLHVDTNTADIEFIDEALDICLSQGDDSSFETIFTLIASGKMSVDYFHSTKGRSSLAIAAEKGFYSALTELLQNFNANPSLRDVNGKTAFDYADENFQKDCCELLVDAIQQFKLNAYNKTNEIDGLDHELLNHVLISIHTMKPIDGSILVFLPGYDDIMVQKDMIETRFHVTNYRLYVLHSGVNGAINVEQMKVFHRMPSGIRKIILSTNIAETSLTIEDVVYVVDLGKMKQLSYDPFDSSTCLATTNISKACAQQRAGRAGRVRNGFCYRLYSTETFEKLVEHTLPEIQRIALTDICLKAKVMSDSSIEDFLTKAIHPPSVSNIRESIKLLKKIDALDDQENITCLGQHLVTMPVDCKLGKMLLYAILMRCLDPVVTIVSALSVKEPFALQTKSRKMKNVGKVKEEFAEHSLSDFKMLLNVFEAWFTSEGRAGFSENNGIHHQNLQMIAVKSRASRSSLSLIISHWCRLLISYCSLGSQTYLNCQQHMNMMISSSPSTTGYNALLTKKTPNFCGNFGQNSD
ncbi:3'-5' RNA helicase YTHDC2-like [Sitodiplosis mosellana]|uniref:3'-5' RNA helicase YTHDC2-like n=1 Tax=Sitodiplosis mosellana TaxID=263140 RepID=UPI002443A2DA|nr:3'-5' RNA helicase YTHDC2-like [Sitodiplosis mosellana]